MREATSTPTTTRRSLFGAPAAMLPLAAPAAGPTKAAELDGELLAACERFIYLEGEYSRLCRATDYPPGTPQSPARTALKAEFEAISDEQHELGHAIARTPARTPEGVQAKARGALIYMAGNPPVDMLDALRASILHDIAGRA